MRTRSCSTSMPRSPRGAQGRIGERTRAALSARKAQGAKLGIRSNPSRAPGLGRKAQTDEADQFAANLMPLVRAIQGSGAPTWTAMAQALNDRRIRSARGGRWHVSTVQNLLAR